jgi:DNA-binding IclR family transcriptional regulator
MTDMTAAVFDALGSTEAVDLVVRLLGQGAAGATVGQLQEAASLPQPTVTRALQCLLRVGILKRDQTTKAYVVASAEDTRRLLDQASELALAALKTRTAETESLQRRVRKTRLSSAKGSGQPRRRG